MNDKLKKVAQIVKHLRENSDAITAYINELCDTHHEALNEFQRSAIHSYAYKAFLDAKSLDYEDDSEDFLTLFIFSTLDSGFVSEILYFEKFPFNKKSMRLAFNEYKASGNIRTGFITFHFREYLRDGFSIERAHEFLAEEIAEEIKTGNFKLLTTLAEIKKKPLPTHSPTGWIIRAWIPLALWQTEERDVLERRVKRARLALFKAGANVPDIPEPTEGNPYPIMKLILSVRSKIRTKSR